MRCFRLIAGKPSQAAHWVMVIDARLRCFEFLPSGLKSPMPELLVMTFIEVFSRKSTQNASRLQLVIPSATFVLSFFAFKQN